jgi:hypothetical protein
MEMVIDLESVTPTQETVNIISPGEHMLAYRNKVQLAKLIQHQLRQRRRSNTTESPTPKKGNQSYQHALKHGVPGKTARKTWTYQRGNWPKTIHLKKGTAQNYNGNHEYGSAIEHKQGCTPHDWRLKITVPVAMERGGSSRSEVALDNIQRKCQSLLKAMQKADRKLYILPFNGAYRPMNGNITTIMKPEEFPSDFDEFLKYTPELYVRTEAGAIYGKWLLAHDAPIQEIVSNISHSFKAEQHQVVLLASLPLLS